MQSRGILRVDSARLRELNEAGSSMVTLIGDRYGRMPVILGIIVGLITTVILSLAGPSALLLSDYIAMISFLFTLLTFSFISLVGNMARELETGEAALYTYTRLGRIGYVASWVTAVEVQTLILVFIALTLPVLFFAPRALLNTEVILTVGSILLQLTYHALILVAISVVTRNYRRYLSIAFGVLIIFPLGFTVFMAMLSAADIIDFDTLRAANKAIATVTYPLFMVLNARLTGNSVIPPLVYTLAAIVVLHVIIAWFASRRMEV